MPNPDVLQFDRVHQVMQRHVSIAATQAGEQGRHQARERDQGITAECAEQKVEPDYVRLQAAQCFQQPVRTRRIIKRPAADHRKTVEFRVLAGKFIRQDGQVQERITL